MNRFSNLLNKLLLTTSRNKKKQILFNYFKQACIKDKAWTFTILTNRFEKKFLQVKELKTLVESRVDPELFKYSYDYVGDLAETISLIWPKKKIKKEIDLKLFEFMEFLEKKQDKVELIKELKSILDLSHEQQRYTIIKILTGGLRVGVSVGLIKESLVKYSCRSISEIEEFWYGFKFPYTDFFDWLVGKELPKYINKKQLFNSFMLAHNFKFEDFKNKESRNYFSEFKWDGIRAQVIFSDKGKIYSRNGEDITANFPDIELFDQDYYVVDGELVIKKDNKILSFNTLQKRIGRKKPSKKLLEDYPIHLIVYDILFFKDKDCRSLPLFERREYLNKLINKKKNHNLSLSELIKFSNWEDLKDIKENSINNHIEGVVLKNKFSSYQKGRVVNGWYKWKRTPYSVDFIIMYAQRGHGKRSSFYSDFTFGCWVDNNLDTLVPVGKAYSGYTDSDLKKLDLWIRNNTIQRFGPVRSVKPGLVVEISFDNINISTRHKSGVALRFPRFSKIRWDRAISDVCTLEYVKDLIN